MEEKALMGVKKFTLFYVCFMVKIPVLPEESALDIHTVMIMLQKDNLYGLT